MISEHNQGAVDNVELPIDGTPATIGDDAVDDVPTQLKAVHFPSDQ